MKNEKEKNMDELNNMLEAMREESKDREIQLIESIVYLLKTHNDFQDIVEPLDKLVRLEFNKPGILEPPKEWKIEKHSFPVSGEAGYFPSKIRILSVSHMNADVYEVRIECEMYYMSAHIYYEEDGTLPDYANQTRKGFIRIVFNEKDKKADFYFGWENEEDEK